MNANPLRALAWALLAMTLAACSGSLLPKPDATPALYTLGAPVAAPQRPAPAGAPTLLIAPPRPAPGHDSRLIAYQRQPQRLDYFAHSEWVDTPAALLAPLVARAAQDTGTFGAVLLAPTTAAADARLELEQLRLLQDFSTSPSQVHLSVQAVLVDVLTRRVRASQSFEAHAPSPSEDAAGGAAAAQQAARELARTLAAFCAAQALPAPKGR